MKRVTGIGGILFECENPQEMKSWYQKHLGLQTDAYGTNFEWRTAEDPIQKGFTQWSPMPKESAYLKPSNHSFMMNYRVADLATLVPVLIQEGVQILDDIEEFEYGKFVHILDPEGNKIELWEPNDEAYDQIVDGRTK
jgi:catechol 2,3-dioxygenase-like lactoylglutathione lyase family enzyme